MSEQPRPPRLDPDRAIEAAAQRTGAGPDAAGADTGEAKRPTAPERPSPPRAPVINPRRYQRMIAGFGGVLVLIFSLYLFVNNGVQTPGIAAGQKLHFFVAPLATSDLNLPANGHPHCDPAHPARRGLNVCGRKPVAIAFFATGAGPCTRSVDALQALSTRYPGIQFAAVAVNASRGTTAKLVRARHWTIPVAFDSTGAIGIIYGVSVCPLLELARRGGIVANRLIGERWTTSAALEPLIRRLAQSR